MTANGRSYPPIIARLYLTLDTTNSLHSHRKIKRVNIVTITTISVERGSDGQNHEYQMAKQTAET